MVTIRVLPEAIANKIAAGEVIERPASIVKELVENALDAGARSIDLEVNHGGRSLIRVADDGCGMTREDAPAALKRHATSKIASLEDLSRLRSLGFRGEALPSIAAVSRLKLLTRAGSASVGTELVVEGGALRSTSEAACRQGTVVEVRDLFFNTPARRKFLRSEATELGHILDTVSHLSLAHLSVRFTLRSSEQVLLDLPAVEAVKDRAAEIFGEGSSKHLLEVSCEAEGVCVRGVIGKPFLARASRSGQIFFVNRRWVRSPGLSYALIDGYHGLLMHGQYPVAVLFVDLDLARVDVNVHPTKQEVRVSNEAEVKSLVKKAVTECLQREGDLAPTLAAAAGDLAFLRDRTAFTGAPQAPVAPLGSRGGLETYQSAASGLALTLPGNKLHITRVLGQIHGTFLVAETEEGLVIVDQHAAHERVMFEALLANFREGRAERQSLLMEEVLELGPRQFENLGDSLKLLERVGFDLEPFGERAFIVRAYPAVLGSEDPLAFLKTFLEEKEDGRVTTSLERETERVAALVACKRKSVKAHDALAPQAIQSLLARLAACETPFSCPHGRPTFFKLTFSDLEKQFKRK